MNAQHLRIGNIVTINNSESWPKLKGISMKVTGLKEVDVRGFPNSKHGIDLLEIDTPYPKAYSQFDEFVEEVILTEEWLIKFGFTKNVMSYEINVSPNPKSYKLLSLSGDYLYLKEGFSKTNCDICVIWNRDYKKQFYVHELQNVYYDISGNELSVKKIK